VGSEVATLVAQKTVGAALANAQIWSVASGNGSSLSASTSATITMTFDTGNPAVVAQAYRMTGGTITPAATASGTSSVSITVPADGCAIVVLENYNTNAVSLSNVTEDYNQAETTSNQHRGVMGSTSTPGSLTSTMTGTQFTPQIAAAAF
jgi:hypothetical protein